jgi:hypothetical protein
MFSMLVKMNSGAYREKLWNVPNMDHYVKPLASSFLRSELTHSRISGVRQQSWGKMHIPRSMVRGVQ